MKTTVPFYKKALLLSAIALCSANLFAQTYTTIANGSWNSASTWAGGTIPPSTIPAGSIVNIQHKVTFTTNTDFIVNGTLNVSNDTLFFSNSYNKNVTLNSGGIIKIQSAGLSQVSNGNAGMILTGGKLILSGSYLNIAKDMEAQAGSIQSIKNSTVVIGRNYSVVGSAGTNAIDTIQFTNFKTGASVSGNFLNDAYSKLYVGNAYVQVMNGGDFINKSTAAINILPLSNRNMGFDFLKSTGKLQNDGAWNARIDAACVTGSITGSAIWDIDFTRAQDCSSTPLIGPAPELVFQNPVLVSGQDKKQGAVYRFANVKAGVDAQIKLKKLSRADIVINSIDNTSFGWDKAFQPEFGLAGNVAPNQNWYIDFELKFYAAGTNTPVVMPKVDMTALDVDGDGVSISEYVAFQNPSNISYASLSSLTQVAPSVIGQLHTCAIDNLPSLVISCPLCGGDGKTGIWNLDDCALCNATGALFSTCNHAYDDVNATTEQGPVTNFVNIDTSATQVMTVYQFTDRQVINFRYGARSGSSSSSAGIRLNSLWFRQFSLTPYIAVTLPVKMESFTATLNNTGQRVDLKWTTASELNVSHFVVERSTDGSHYSDAGIVFAYGNATDKTDYSFPDNISAISSTVIYYRLRSVDIDGKSQYSDTRIIRLGKQIKNEITIAAFPNPVSNEVRIGIPNEWQNKKVIYEIMNASGQTTEKKEVTSSSQTESINIAALARGLYIVRVSCEGQSAQQKIIKQ